MPFPAIFFFRKNEKNGFKEPDFRSLLEGTEESGNRRQKCERSQPVAAKTLARDKGEVVQTQRHKNCDLIQFLSIVRTWIRRIQG